MRIPRSLLSAFVGVFLVVASPSAGQTNPLESIDNRARCSVCGMFVAKYADWVTQIHFSEGQVKFFDGVKDMMVFYLNPDSYGYTRDAVREIWVKDYYTLQWIDGRAAFYVVGSDVFGPMGKEFIPFQTKAAAENFLKDHKGRQSMAFDEITDALVQSMRSGQKMRH